MFEGIRLSTLDRGPGHWPGTAMPGELGNVVVAGHRVSHNEDFRNLDQLVPGDEVIFNTAVGSSHVPRPEHRGRRARGDLDRRPDPCPHRDPVRVPSSGIDSPAHRRAPRTRSLSRFALALGSGFLVALSLPPWGWWPLAFVGIALFEVSLGAGHRAPDALRPRHDVRLRLDVHGHGVDVAPHRARLPHRQLPLRRLPRARRARRTRPAGGASSGGRRPTRWSRRCASPSLLGGVPLASLGISQAAGPLAELARVGGVILITWVVFQVGFALGALLERDARSHRPGTRRARYGRRRARRVVRRADQVVTRAPISMSLPCRAAVSRARARSTCRRRS